MHAKRLFDDGKVVSVQNLLQFIDKQSLGLSEKQLWWKLKFDCDFELADIEMAKTDAYELQNLRQREGLGDLYRSEFYAMIAICYHFQIKADSALFYSLKALDLYRSLKSNKNKIDAFRIYFANAASARNDLEKIYKLYHGNHGTSEQKQTFGYSYIPAMFDTAAKYTKSPFMLAKIYRSFGNYYLDYSDKSSNNNNLSNLYYNNTKKYYLLSNNILTTKCKSPAASIAYNNCLLGILEMYNLNFKAGRCYFIKAKKLIEELPSGENFNLQNEYLKLVYKRYFSTLILREYLSRADKNLLIECLGENMSALKEYNNYIKKLKLSGLPFHDSYSVNPYRNIIEIYLKLNFLTGKKVYLEKAAQAIIENRELAMTYISYNSKLEDSVHNIKEVLIRKFKNNEAFLIYYDTHNRLLDDKTVAILFHKGEFNAKVLNKTNYHGYYGLSVKENTIFHLLNDSTESCALNILNQKSDIYYNSIKNLLPNNINHLIVLPNYELSFLPLEILPIYNSETGHFGDSCLLHKYTIQYFNSPDNFLKDSLKDPIKYVFDNTEVSGKVLYPFSKRSANKITSGERYFKRERSSIPSFLNACENEKSVIYIFSHAYSDPNNQFNSFIKFFKDSLTLNELFKKQFHTNLLCFNACDADYGYYDVNAGKISISDYFLRHGVGSVISGQWPIDDKAGAIITEKMNRFVEQGFSFSEALRKSKIEFISEYPAMSNPVYWASLQFKGTDLYISSFKGPNLMKWAYWLFTIIPILIILFYFRRKN